MIDLIYIRQGVFIGTSDGWQMLTEEKLGERIEYTAKPYVHGGAKSLALYETGEEGTYSYQ